MGTSETTPVHSGSPVVGANLTDATSDRVFALETELVRQKHRMSDFGAMGAIIASILDIEKVMTVVMDMALRATLGEVGAILLENDRELENRIAWGLSAEALKIIRLPQGNSLIEAYRDEDKSYLINEADLAPDSGMKVSSLLAAPIRSRDKRHGLLVILNKERGGTFSAEDLETLETLNNFLAVAIENSRLLESALQRQRMQQELDIAREVQETILPMKVPEHEGFSMGAICVAAREVGGDFYDLHHLRDGSYIIIVGDVSSKGVGAALVMAACSGIIKSKLTDDPGVSMGDLASHLNDTLAEGIIKDKAMFVTIWFGRFHPKNTTLEFCNAGHVPPLLYRHSDESISELSLGGPIIGQFPGATFQQGQVTMSDCDSISLCTDGLTEAENKDGELFGRERFREFVLASAHLDPQEFCRRVKGRIDEFSRGSAEESHDDFTVLQIKPTPCARR